jgi:hypothetical protein
MRTPGTKGIATTAVMPAIAAGTQSHKSRNASNISKESNNRTKNTVGTPEKSGRLAKVVKPATACSEANYSKVIINIRDDNSSRDNRNIMDVDSRRTARIRQ